MTYTFEQIHDAVLQMQAEQGPLIRKMREIQLRYDGDWVLPMPDLEDEPSLPQLTPALVGEAIDQIAMRAASVHPIISSPAINPSKDRGRESRQFAGIRSQIVTATMEKSRWSLGRRRMYRQMTAYHTSCVVVIPDMINQIPRIEVRDPLSTYVEPVASESLRDPNYVATITRVSGHALRAAYPICRAEFGGPITDREMQRTWEVVEWFDAEETVWGLMGPSETFGHHVATNTGLSTQVSPTIELERLPNRAGCVPVMIPRNVSLAGIASRIGSLLGNVDLQAKLMALMITAQEKAIFPDVYAIGSTNGQPTILNGEWRDGRTGDINMLQDVQAVGTLRTSPDPMTGQMIDRMERNFRTSTSLVPQLGGETYGAMRTGRAIDALSGMALDPRVQELHEITEAYLPTLNSAILSTYKGYWGSKQYSMYCGQANRRRLVEFVPREHIEHTETSVSYFVAGADMMQLTQLLGSLRGANAISQRTFQEQHPMIGDADLERLQLTEEQLEEAAKQALQQQILSGQLPPTVAGMIRDEIMKNKTIFEAIDIVDKKLRELQATPATPPQDPAMGAPEAMPGLTGGPEADQQPAPWEPQIETPQGVGAMRQLMQQMGA